MESSANGGSAEAASAATAVIQNDYLKQCAAGELCMMLSNTDTPSNDASTTNHQTTTCCCCCMNCKENMHEVCGCSFMDIESVHGFIIPSHLLSVDGQETLERHSSSVASTAATHSHDISKNKNDLLICSMCIEIIKGEVIAAMNDVMKKSDEDDRKRGGAISSADIAETDASNSRLASVEMIDDDGNDAPIPISQQQENCIDSDMELKRAIAQDMVRTKNSNELQLPESQCQMNRLTLEEDDDAIKKRESSIPSQPILNHNPSSSSTLSFNEQQERQSSSTEGTSGRWRSRSRYQMNSTTTAGTTTTSMSSDAQTPLRTAIEESDSMDVQSQYTSGNQSHVTHSTGGTRTTAEESTVQSSGQERATPSNVVASDDDDVQSSTELLEPQIPLEAVVVEEEEEEPDLVYDAVIIQPEDDESRHPPPKRKAPWYKRTSKRLISLVLLISIGFAAMIGVILGTQLDSSNNNNDASTEKNNEPSTPSEEGDNENPSLFGGGPSDGGLIMNLPSSLRPSTSPSLFPSSFAPIIPTPPPTPQPITPKPTKLLYYADYVNKRCSNDPANRPSANLGQKLYDRVEDCCNAAFYYLQNYDCVLASLGVSRAPTPLPTTKVPTTSPSDLPTLSPLTPTYYPSISNLPTPTPTVHWEPKGETLLGKSANDWAGRSVSLSGDASILAIGASRHDTIGNNAGHVQVYKWVRWTITGTPGWNVLGKFIDGDQAGDWFGHSVSLSNDGMRLAVGAQYADGNVSS